MQTLESEYGLEPLTVDDKVPTTWLRWWLGGVHVGTSFREVLREVHDRIKKHKDDPGWTRELRKQTYAAAIWLHKDNRAEYAWIMGGMP